MAIKSVFKADVGIDGKISKIWNKHFFDQDLKDHAGKQIRIEITRWRKPRSNRQNAFYFYIFLQQQIECFKEFWGEVYTKEQMHDWNKAKFWGEERMIEATGEIIMSPGTSTDKSTVEFEERLETIRIWFRQNFEFEIAYPNEQSELEFQE